MNLTKVIEKVKEFLGKITETFKSLVAALGNLFAHLPGLLKPVRGKVASFSERSPRSADKRSDGSNRFSGGKRRTLFFVLGGLAALFLVLLIAAVAINSRGAKKSASVDMSAGLIVAPEELFPPAEPDFLPELILEREPRRSWSIEDIRPYWKNPENPGVWRDLIKSTVDELMESVP